MRYKILLLYVNFEIFLQNLQAAQNSFPTLYNLACMVPYFNIYNVSLL